MNSQGLVISVKATETIWGSRTSINVLMEYLGWGDLEIQLWPVTMGILCEFTFLSDLEIKPCSTETIYTKAVSVRKAEQEFFPYLISCVFYMMGKIEVPWKLVGETTINNKVGREIR